MEIYIGTCIHVLGILLCPIYHLPLPPFLTFLPAVLAIVRERGSFVDAAQREKMREREALESGLMFSRDRLIEMIAVCMYSETSLIRTPLGQKKVS